MHVCWVNRMNPSGQTWIREKSNIKAQVNKEKTVREQSKNEERLI